MCGIVGFAGKHPLPAGQQYDQHHVQLYDEPGGYPERGLSDRDRLDGANRDGLLPLVPE